MILTNLLSFLVFPAIVLFHLKIEERNDVIGINDSNIMKGIAAIFIFLAHFYNRLSGKTNIGIGKMWLYMGGVGVCLFFFLSGYGLNRSDSIEKPGFIVKRTKNVLIPFVITRSACFLIDSSLWGKGFSFFMEYVLGIQEPLWFVTVILLIYIGYYFCYKLFGRNRLNVAVALYNVGIGILFWALGANPRWYNAHLLFSAGMIIADHNDAVISALKKYGWWLCNVVLGSGFLLFSALFSMNKDSLGGIAFKLASGVFVCLLFMNLFLRVRLRSDIMKWVGKNSLLFYIIHLQVLRMPSMNGVEDKWFLPVGLLTTVLCVLSYELVKKHVRRNVEKK